MMTSVLTAGVLGSMLVASVALWTGEHWIAIAALLSMSAFSAAFGLVNNEPSPE